MDMRGMTLTTWSTRKLIRSARLRCFPMSQTAVTAVYVFAMIAVIVGVDVAFFRNMFWARLTVNIAIVVVFAAFYLRFLKQP